MNRAGLPLRVAGIFQPARLRGRRDLFLVRHVFYVDAAGLDAFFEGKRQLQHPMAVGRADLFDVQELRKGKRLFVSRCGSVAGYRLISTNGHGVTCGIQVHVSRIDAGKGHVNTPPVVGGGHLEGWRVASSRTTWKLIPELIEDALNLPFESEKIVDRVTGHSKHGQLPPLSCSLIDLNHAFLHVKYGACNGLNISSSL